MGAEYKEFITIKEVIDHDTGMYQIGELDGFCDERRIEKYLTDHGEYGKDQLIEACVHLIYLTQKIFRKLPEEIRFPGMAKACVAENNSVIPVLSRNPEQGETEQ
jgi:glutamate racemase